MLTDRHKVILEKAISEFYKTYKERFKDVERAIKATRNYATEYAKEMF
ncbi:MAG: hypothetical protein QXD42_04015 [Nitrososphaerales archaeon]